MTASFAGACARPQSGFVVLARGFWGSTGATEGDAAGSSASAQQPPRSAAPTAHGRPRPASQVAVSQRRAAGTFFGASAATAFGASAAAASAARAATVAPRSRSAAADDAAFRTVSSASALANVAAGAAMSWAWARLGARRA